MNGTVGNHTENANPGRQASHVLSYVDVIFEPLDMWVPSRIPIGN